MEWWAENPSLYFEINPEGVDYGFFYWRPPTATMEDFRRRIAAKPDEFLSMIASVEEAVGQKVQAECYKRPKPCENEALLPYFAWKGVISCSRHEDFGANTFTEELRTRVRKFFEDLIPMYEYFNTFKVG